MSETQYIDLQASVAFCGKILTLIASPEFSLSVYPYADKRPHAWKVIENGESPKQVGIIELKRADFLTMSAPNDAQKAEYLGKRFKPFFDRLRKT